MSETNFALFFGNRGFFPEKLVATARAELPKRLKELGYDSLMMDAAATPFGAVESAAQGEIYARWLAEQKGKFQGVILCLPNFGDETGAVAALQAAGVPILIVAYADAMDKMSFANRRDAFCGKFSVMDVFVQYGIPFTAFQPHVTHPSTEDFAKQIHDFAAVCRVTLGMKKMTVGAIGARTSAFKTVRYDELALQRYGVTTEVTDLSSVIERVRKMADSDRRVAEKAGILTNYTDCSCVPKDAMHTLAKLGVVIDEVIAEQKLDTVAIRCWLELEQQLRVAPCVLVSEINDRSIPCACEVDVCNAVAMHALRLASKRPATCLDWNNNYGTEANKCILFHCGPVPQSLMKAKGKVIDHPMFAKALGDGCGWGPNVGRIASSPMTFASCKTDRGNLTFYMGEGKMTEDEIPAEFFGCAGVAEIPDLQRKLQTIGYGGYRHHVSMTFGHVETAVREAFVRYLGYEVQDL